MKAKLAAGAAGLLFALGLGLGGMTDVDKVLSFLDFTRAWDPSLAFVMAGALLVHAPLRAWTARALPAPLLSSSYSVPRESGVDGRLVLGATLFGAGWGLVGLCPGPAVVNLLTGSVASLVFVAGMLGGTVALQQLERERLPPAATDESACG